MNDRNEIFSLTESAEAGAEICVCSDIGSREEQQDCVFARVYGHSAFCAVCDGMGGLNDGAAASRTAAQTAVSEYERMRESETPVEFFSGLVDKLDQAVSSLKNKSGLPLNAGTTICAVITENGALNWFSVGDSRIYIFRGDEAVRITNDHNYKQELDAMLAAGKISGEVYACELPKAQSLTSFIGMKGVRLFDVNKSPLPLQPGDAVLLTTDGLYKCLSDEEISAVFRRGGTALSAAKELLRSAAEKTENRDNTSFVVILYK